MTEQAGDAYCDERGAGHRRIAPGVSGICCSGVFVNT
jgi:hypothetical protein